MTSQRPFNCRWSAIAPAFLVVLFSESHAHAQEFIRGDVNRDGQVTLSDASYLFDFRFLGGPAPGCMDAADCDDNGAFDTVGIVDTQRLLSWLFRGPIAPSLPAPFPKPGVDPTADGLNCALPGFDPPGRPLPGFAMELSGSKAVNRGAFAEFFLLATTAKPIECVSIVLRVDKRAARKLTVDLQGTIFPSNLRAPFESSPAFHFSVGSSADPLYDLLIAGAIFVTEPTEGIRRLGGPVGPFERIQFAATQGPLKAAKLLRVKFQVPPDAPQGEVVVFLPPEDDDFFVAGSFVHGVKNEYGVIDLDKPGGNTFTTPTPAHVAVDGEQFLRGDGNSDRRVDLSDAVHTLSFLFTGGPSPACRDRSDSNDDGKLDISDASYTLNFLFLGGPPPVEPGPFICGFDLAGDEFDPCEEKSCP
jgi:hypothetical protein